jgi:hypothetical protein
MMKAPISSQVSSLPSAACRLREGGQPTEHQGGGRGEGDQRVIKIGEAPADDGEHENSQGHLRANVERQGEPDRRRKTAGDQDGQAEPERASEQTPMIGAEPANHGEPGGRGGGMHRHGNGNVARRRLFQSQQKIPRRPRLAAGLRRRNAPPFMIAQTVAPAIRCA